MTTTRKPDINLWEVLHRKRFGLGPFYVGAVAALLAGVSALLSEWQTLILMIVIGLALAATVHTRVKDPWRKAYLFAVVAIITGWVMFARIYMPEMASWVVLFNVSGCLLFGIGWWSSGRKRSQVKMESSIRDFPQLMERIGYGKVRTGPVTMTKTGFHGRLFWEAGVYDVQEILNKKRVFGNVLGKLAGQMQMEPDGKSLNSVKYRVVTSDPHAAAQLWVPPTQVLRASDPLVIGPRADDEMVSVRRYDPAKGTRNALAAGTIGSGKSSYTNLCVAENVCSDDTFTIGVDMKQVELAPWAPALGYCVTTQPVAAKMFQSLIMPGGLFETRGNILARRKGRVWNTEIDGPLIDFVIDETKELLGNGDIKTVNAVSVLATKGRAYGIRFVLASQYPTLESIGSTQIRQQVGIKLCFRMEDADGESFVLPGHRVRAEDIDEDRPGTCYVKDGSRLNSMPIRVRYIDDALRDMIVEARQGRTAELDSESAAAIERFFPEFKDRPRPGQVPAQRDSDEGMAGTPGGTGPGTGAGSPGTPGGTDDADEAGTVPADGDEESDMADEPEWIDLQSGPELDLAEVLGNQRAGMTQEERDLADESRAVAQAEIEAMESRKSSPEEARESVLTLMAEAWPEGVPAKALIEVTGRSSSWFYPWANALADDGVIKRTGEGTWVLVAAPPQLVK